jgi:hypothetical protein
VLLVAYHAFCPNAMAWQRLYDTDIKSYWWLGKIFYAILLPSFMFISGYLFGNQIDKSGGGNFKTLIIKKGKRLIIPSVIFGTAYIYLLADPNQYTLSQKIVEILRGFGHLWFLPTLFVCFIATWIMHKLHCSPLYVIPLLLPISMIVYKAYYLLFFYGGFCVKAYHVDVIKYAKRKFIILFAVISIFLFIVVHTSDFLLMLVYSDYNIPFSVFKIRFCNLVPDLYAIPGVIALYLWSMNMVYINNKVLPKFFQNLVGTCFGVYLFQEFILRPLYYQSGFPAYISPYLMPWIGFAIALVLSVFISWTLLKSKVGRWLIG